VQYVADTFGNDVTLGERDCSAQRRHQKVIEEAPCPVMTDSLRSAMSDAAKAVARAAGYVNAGTLEFLLDAQNNFYFLEMNTRLQVEHPVTELVTGLDLVELQLRIARGEQLPIAQQDVKLVGHAIEARVYAEDPAEGFRPQTGVILHWRPPTAPSVRVDHGLQDGSTITPYYDPMVAKVMTVGRDRDDARNRLLAALRDTTLLGVHVNLAYLEGILAHPVFAQGAMTTAFLSTADAPPIAHESADALTLAVAAAAWIEHAADSVPPADRGWRSTGPARSLMKLRHRESEHHLSITYRRQQYQVAVGELTYELAGVCLVGDVLRWSQGGLDQQARVLMDDRLLYLQRGTNVFCIEDVTYAPPIDASSSTSGSIKSPMSGRVLSVAAIPGSTVKRGDILVVVEAMKMENHVVAARDGVVEGVHVAAGDQVDANQLLVTLSEVLSENSGAKQEK
jgi:geranyl-CoA carboxylase alpha subunit